RGPDEQQGAAAADVEDGLVPAPGDQAQEAVPLAQLAGPAVPQEGGRDGQQVGGEDRQGGPGQAAGQSRQAPPRPQRPQAARAPKGEQGGDGPRRIDPVIRAWSRGRSHVPPVLQRAGAPPGGGAEGACGQTTAMRSNPAAGTRSSPSTTRQPYRGRR